jgi:probable rRNA maturation factor
LFFEEHVIIFEKAMQGVSRTGLASFARRAQKLAGIPGTVDIMIAGNRRLQELNRRFRKKNQPTDVLSFPSSDGGDIAISAEIARQNAGRYGHSPAAELKVLILHGMLHLAGHDHETDNGRMTRFEARLRAQLKLPSSLTGRARVPEAKKPGRHGRSR